MADLITKSDLSHPINLIEDDDSFNIKTLLDNPFEYSYAYHEYEKWIIGVDSLECKIECPITQKRSFTIGLDEPYELEEEEIENVYWLFVWDFLRMVAEEYKSLWEEDESLFGDCGLEDLLIDGMRLNGNALEVHVSKFKDYE